MSEHIAPPLHEGTVQTTSHVELPERESDDALPVHVMSQVDPLVQVTLPDCATVTVQLELSQFTLPLSRTAPALKL